MAETNELVSSMLLLELTALKRSFHHRETTNEKSLDCDLCRELNHRIEIGWCRSKVRVRDLNEVPAPTGNQ